MTVGDLIELRKAAGMSQTSMALCMGLSLRAYQDVEAGEQDTFLSTRQRNMAEAATLQIAVDHSNPMLTTPKVRDLALTLVEMIRGT